MVYIHNYGVVKQKITLVGLLLIAGLFALLATFGVFTNANAATQTKIVTQSNQFGWIINPDPTNAVPSSFVTGVYSIGAGSLYGGPVGPAASGKFIALNYVNKPVEEVSAISYDFKIAGNGTSASAQQYYLNIYTNVPGSSTYYDCRFDYVPNTGSVVSFTNFTANSNDTPTDVKVKNVISCPSKLDQMPAGSTISFITLNIGDTSSVDNGLAGYFDNVSISGPLDTITYDFEASPISKENCTKNGWQNFSFKNQGLCIQYVNTGKDSRVN